MAKIITENFKAETTKELFDSFDSGVISRKTSQLFDADAVTDTSDPSYGQIQLTNATGLAKGDFVNFGASIPLSSDIKILEFVDATTIRLTADNLTVFNPLFDIPQGAELNFVKADTDRPSTYYVFGSVINGETEITNTQFSSRNFKRKVIFGNKVSETEVRYMFKNSLWEQGKVYDQFDDTQDVATLDMFATVLGDGSSTAELNQSSYKVYKCIRNNLGATSQSVPSVSNVDDNTLRTNDFQITLDDGYVWKFMFEVSPAEYIIYGTSDLLPFNFPGDLDVIDAARESISDIKVVTTEQNVFTKFAPFTHVDEDGATGVRITEIIDTSLPTKKLRVSYPTSAGDRFVADDAYKDMYFYTPLDGILYDITSSTAYDAGGTATLELELQNESLSAISDLSTLDFDLSSTKNYSIVPKVEVSRSTGNRCRAFAVLDSFGNIDDVTIVDGGSDYKFATAKVLFPAPIAPNENNPPAGYTQTTLRCIVSPTGGHGSDPVKELAMSQLSVATTFSGASPFIPGTNSYSQVGLVKNPAFLSETFPEQFDNRTKITFAGQALSNKVFEDYYIKQDVYDGSEIVETVLGQVHEIYYDTQEFIIDSTGATVQNPDYEKTVMFITNNVGDFSAKFSTDPATTNNGTIRYIEDIGQSGDGIDYAINSITDSDYVPYSGDLLHFIDFSPIDRSEDRLEKIKFVFDF